MNATWMTVEDEADPLCVLDWMVAILWQGRSIAVSVVVAQGDESYRAMDLDPRTSIEVWEPERDGPRPDSATFVEPELPPACRCRLTSMPTKCAGRRQETQRLWRRVSPECRGQHAHPAHHGRSVRRRERLRFTRETVDDPAGGDRHVSHASRPWR